MCTKDNIVKLNLSDQDVRRIKSLVNVDDYLVVRIKNGMCLFLGIGGSLFKCHQVRCSGGIDGNYKLFSDAFINITSGGFLGFIANESKMIIAFSCQESEFDKGVYDSITDTPINSVDDFILREYLAIIKGTQGSMMYIEELTNLKDIIKICTYNKIGIEIFNGYIYSASNSLKMFKPIEDKELAIGLDIDALKEIDKFGTDCKMHDVSNYLVLARDNYMLAVRKCTLAGINYPESLYDDSCATTCSAVNITKLAELMKTYNKHLEKVSEGFVKFNLSSSQLEVFNGRTTFHSKTFCRQVETSQGYVANSILIPLANIHSLGILKEQENVVVYSYGKILRLCFANGINLLMKGDVA